MRPPLQPLLVSCALAAGLALAQSPPPGAEPAPAPSAAPSDTPAPAASDFPSDTPASVYSETLDVELMTLTVRVEDRRRGGALAGLGAADFRLFAADRELEIAAVEWIGATLPDAVPESLAELESAGFEPAPAKLVVLFVQADFHPTRMSGQLRMLPEAKRFVDTLGYEDSVAVVSFDSHLKLRQDFTRDRERVRQALDEAIRTGPEPWLRRTSGPSLARHFDFAGAQRAARPERGLELTARALEPLPGPKVFVYLGWGLGRFGATGVTLPPEYGAAVESLRRGHTAVFVLDVTEADYHSLEEGLKEVAADTGGTYSKTHQNPKAATRRVAELATGHYVLYFRPPGPGVTGRLRVALAEPRRGEVLVAPAELR